MLPLLAKHFATIILSSLITFLRFFSRFGFCENLFIICLQLFHRRHIPALRLPANPLCAYKTIKKVLYFFCNADILIMAAFAGWCFLPEALCKKCAYTQFGTECDTKSIIAAILEIILLSSDVCCR